MKPKHDSAARHRAAEAQLKAQTGPCPPLNAADARRLLHELEVQKIELEMQNAELLAASVELEAALDRYTDLFDVAPVGFLDLTSDGTISLANSAGADLLGEPRGRLIGQRFQRFLREQNQSAFRYFLQQTLTFGPPHGCEVTLVRKDGSQRILQITGTRTRTGLNCRLVMLEVTKHRQAQSDLVETQENLFTLIDAMPDNVIFKDGEGRWLVVNSPAMKFFQLADVRWQGRTDAELAVANPALKSLHEACIRSDEIGWTAGKLSRVTERGPGPDGKMQEHEVQKVPLFHPDGRRQAMLIVGRDVTEKRRLEQSLKMSELMASQSRDVQLLVRRSDGQLCKANHAAEEYYGYPRAELLTRNIADLRETNDAAQTAQQMAEAFAKGIQFETVHVRKDGGVMPVEVSSQGIHFEGEDYLVSVIRDISVRKQTEAKLHQLEQSMAVAANGIFLVDTAGKIFWVNAAFTRLTGYRAEEALGQTPRLLKSGQHDVGFYRQMWQTVLAKKVWQGELINRRKNGTLYNENKTITPVKDAADRVTHFICVQEDITERKQAEAKIQAAAVFNQATIDALAAHLCVLDEHGTILATNRAWKAFTESSPTPAQNTLVGGNYLAVCDATVGPETADARTFAAGIRAVIQGERDRFSLEYTCHPPKEQFWFVASVTRFNESIPARVVVTHENISERKRTEAEIIRARDFHLRLLEKAPALIWRAGLDGKCNWFNEAWLAFTGRTRAQEMGDGWLAGVHPDDLDGCVKNHQASFHQREPFTLQYRLRRQDGQYRWISDQGNPYESLNGEFAGYIGFCYDIHESILAKELLEERVQERTQEIALLSEVIDQSEVAFAIVHPDGRLIRINAAYTRLVGYSHTEVLEIKGAWASELTPPEWQPLSAAKVEECLRTRLEVRFEKEYRRKDGTRVPVELFMQPIYDAAGNFVHLRAFITDISLRKRTEAALVQSMARSQLLSEVVEHSELPFCIGTATGQLTMANEAFIRLTGYPRDELTDMSFSWTTQLTPPEWRAADAKIMAECQRTRQPVRIEKEYTTKDGRRIPVELFVQPIFNELGQLLNFRVFLTDISVRKQQAAELKVALERADQASRAKSDFLSHMSHEIRTPMNAILGFTQILQQDTTLPAGVQEKLQTIGRSGQNLLGILNDILDLAKVEAGRTNLSPMDFHLRDFVEEIVDLFRPPAENKSLSLRLVMPAEIPRHVWADADKIRRVLGNLLGNAVKFTQTGGIEVTVAVATGPGQTLRLRLAVRDTGPGLALPDIVHRLFKKFEQINPDQLNQAHAGGTGLGLSISQQYARLMGGDL
ncbi:MAG: PAS domain S-box protein, partial [Verrucomicrobiota bacterium]